jgi:hypothetical protein
VGTQTLIQTLTSKKTAVCNYTIKLNQKQHLGVYPGVFELRLEINEQQ